MMFATARGLVTYVESTKKWELFTSKNSALPVDVVAAIMEDRSGKTWLGAGHHILVLEP
jgi:ligand-binding sensor domain-containing protein